MRVGMSSRESVKTRAEVADEMVRSCSSVESETGHVGEARSDRGLPRSPRRARGEEACERGRWRIVVVSRGTFWGEGEVEIFHLLLCGSGSLRLKTMSDCCEEVD